MPKRKQFILMNSEVTLVKATAYIKALFLGPRSYGIMRIVSGPACDRTRWQIVREVMCEDDLSEKENSIKKNLLYIQSLIQS